MGRLYSFGITEKTTGLLFFLAILCLVLTDVVEAAPSLTGVTLSPNINSPINSTVQATLSINAINADLSFNSEVRMKEAGVDISDQFSFQFIFQDPDTTCPFIAGRFSCFSDDVPFDPISTPYTISLIFNWTPNVAGFRQIDFEFTTGGVTQTESAVISILPPANSGSIQFASSSYTINEGSVLDIQLDRVGGNNGALLATLSGLPLFGTPNPASTDDYVYPLTGPFSLPSIVITWADGDASSKILSIPINQDALVEGPEVFHVSYSPVGGVGQVSTTVTIIDSTNPGSIEFNRNFFEGPETLGQLTVSAIRTGGSDGVAEVDVDFRFNQTLSAADIVLPVSTRLSWADGEAGVKSFDVQLVQDSFEGNSESTSIDLVSVNGSVLGSRNRVAFVVYDDTAFYTVDTSYPVSFTEGETLAISVDRFGNNSIPQDIDVTLNHGTTDTNDFSAGVTTQLSWVAGEVGIKTASIPMSVDLLNEGIENFTVTLTYSGGSVLHTTPLISVSDSTSGSLQFENTNYSASEGGNATINVTRNGGSNGAYSATVIFGLAGDTASPADYTDPASVQLDWADGDSATKSIIIPVNSDILVEATETLSLRLSSSTPSILGTQILTVLSITDTTTPGLMQFETPTLSAAEGNTATVNVTRTGGSDGAYSANVVIGLAGDTASTADFITPTTLQLDWLDGDAATKSISVPLMSDILVEGNEMLTFNLTSATPAILGTQAQTILTITDTTTPGTLQFDNSNYVSSEGGNAGIIVTRTGGSDGPVSATIILGIGGDTASSADYTTPASLQINWADGDSASKSILIPILNDILVEGTENLTLQLTSADPTILGSILQADLAITDSTNPGTIQFSSSTYNSAEGGFLNIDITRTGGSDGAITGNFTFGMSGDTADSFDIALVSLSQVDWADGESSTKTLNIQFNSDQLVEGDETYSVGLTSSNPALVGTPAITVVTITDTTTPGTLEFSSTTYSATEGANASIIVDRVGGSDGPLAATLVFGSAGDSASVVDYNVPQLVLNWADGETGSKTVSVPVLNDILVEGDELLSVQLTATDPGFLGSTVNTTITIIDATTPGTLQFSSAMYSASEGDSAILSITRIGGIDGPLSANIVLGGATSTASLLDYTTPATTQLDWLDGEAGTKTIQIALQSDSLVEGDEVLNIQLNTPYPGSITQALLTIVDSAIPQGTAIQFSGLNHGSSEGGIAAVTIQRTGDGIGAVSATLTLGGVGDTATPDDYHFPTTTILGWQDGDTTPITLQLPTIADQIAEGTESLTLTLSSQQPGLIGTPSENKVYIEDTGIGPSYTSTAQTPNSIVTPGTTVTYSVEMRIPVGISFQKFLPITNNGVNIVSVMSYDDSVQGSAQCTKNAANGTFDCMVANSSSQVTSVFFTFDWQPQEVGLNRIVIDFGGSSGTQFVFNTYVMDQPLSNNDGLNQEQKATVQALDSSCEILSGNDLLSLAEQDLLDTCLRLDAASDITAELQQLIPEELSSQITAAFTAANLQVRNVSSRLFSLRGGANGIDLSGINLNIDGQSIPGSILNMALKNSNSSTTPDTGIQRWGAFVNANVTFGEQGATLFSDGFDFDARGITAGIDYRESRDKVFGLAVGYDTNETTFAGENAGMDMDSLHLSFYGSWYQPSNFYVDGLIKLGWNRYDTRRDVTLSGDPLQLLSGSTKSIENSVSLGAGYDKSIKGLTLGGYGRFDYTYVTINGYDEKPGDTSAPGIGSVLHIDNQRLDSITATAGSELSYSINTKKGVFVPQLRLEWEHLIRDNRSAIEAQFIHDPTSTSFSVASEENPDTDYFNIGTGFSVVTPRGKSGFLYIEKRLLQENTEQTWIKGGVRIEF